MFSTGDGLGSLVDIMIVVCKDGTTFPSESVDVWTKPSRDLKVVHVAFLNPVAQLLFARADDVLDSCPVHSDTRIRSVAG